jgi:hypothetical protein
MDFEISAIDPVIHSRSPLRSLSSGKNIQLVRGCQHNIRAGCVISVEERYRIANSAPIEEVVRVSLIIRPKDITPEKTPEKCKSRTVEKENPEVPAAEEKPRNNPCPHIQKHRPDHCKNESV